MCNDITKEEEEATWASRPGIVFYKNVQWEKKEENFDETMGAKGGGECCEVIDLCILNEITVK